MTTLRDKEVRGREDYHCDLCSRIIPQGERHRVIVFIGDDGLQQQRGCAHCQTLLTVIYTHDPDLIYEEYWDLSEYIAESSGTTPELIAAWRAQWTDVDPANVRELATLCFPPHLRRAS